MHFSDSPGLGSLLSNADRQPSETLLFDVIHDVLCRVGWRS